MIEVTTLKRTEFGEYECFLKSLPQGLYYYSTDFKCIIEKELKLTSRYGILRVDGKLAGVLPCFVKENVPSGAVLNSLPFFGSNGGILIDEQYDSEATRNMLIDYLLDIRAAFNCISSVIITSPLETNLESYLSHYRPDLKDTRTGQITELTQDNLTQFSEMRRRGIKKALKNSVTIRISECATPDELEQFYDLHLANMQRLGGLTKSLSMVSKLNTSPNSRIIFAEFKGRMIAGLLCMHQNRTVEYYIPVFDEEYKQLNALSLAIYYGMNEAFGQGYRYWNFGGTWPSQDGVYTFKKHFGARDFQYHYYIKLYRDLNYFRSIGKDTILREYPFLYVIPFDQIS